MEIKHATMIPLIGGMGIGQRLAFGNEPIWETSFELFRENDRSYKTYYDLDIKYIQGNSFNDYLSYFESLNLPFVDVVTTVPPCAGLSMLNRETSKRGSEAPQNDWIYIVTKLLLKTIRPHVIIGENAPGLFTKMGDGVRYNLLEIAIEHGYTIQFIKTDTFLHGIPQHRHRTFFILFDNEYMPIFNYIKRDTPTITEYLKGLPYDKADEINPTLNEHLTFKFMQQIPEWRMYLSENLDVWHFIMKYDLWEDFEDFVSNFNDGQKWIDKSKYIQHKLSIGKGFWNDSITYYGSEYINAVIGKNVSKTLHPFEDRSFTKTELLYLMGHPKDFKLVTKLPHIFQNVPSSTARDWLLEIKAYLEGNRKILKTDAIMFNNEQRKYFTNTITYGEKYR